MWMIRRIGIVAAAIGLAPLALITLASAIGCPISSGGMTCTVLGTDVGSLVVPLFVVSLFSAPPAAGIALAWLLIEIINFLRLRYAIKRTK